MQPATPGPEGRRATLHRGPRRNRTKRSKPIRTAALAGALGAPLFAALLATLTALQYDFMVGIGWKPLGDPAAAWPSSLALGRHGWAMDLGFLASGILLVVFALGLDRAMPRGPKTGPALLLLSGAAMALLAFETDPISRTGPRSWHGLVHDAAFVVFALALFSSPSNSGCGEIQHGAASSATRWRPPSSARPASSCRASPTTGSSPRRSSG